ncbi:MAG: histidine ammonia-lyase [Phycisphaerae bacterium]
MTHEGGDASGLSQGLNHQDPVAVTLDGGPRTIARLDELLGRPLTVELAEAVWRRIDAGAEAIRRIASGSEAVYGVNTGFGPLCTKRITADQLEKLQQNLILSHAVGVGEPAPAEVVRWMMLFKLHALSHGVSGIRRETAECLRRMLCSDLLPVIPKQGSLGASGDLAPLAHMVLPMLGRGRVSVDGRERPASEAMSAAGIETVVLGPKEGLALINGTQFMASYAAVMAVRARRLLKHTDLVATMSLEGLKGSAAPFDEALHRLRPHPGAEEVAQNVRRLMVDSEVLVSHADCDRVQDPYSLRCVPQVHGASRDALRHATEVIETEINSVTDNPLVLDGDRVVSGGAFHGQPLALVMDYAAIALAELASISERRIYLLLSGDAELPILLMKDTGINSGFILGQYTAAALVSENKGLCTPASVDSIPTSLGQEDHVSMGARAAVKCLTVLDNTETVLAIEQLCAAQALDYRSPLKPGAGLRAAHARLREVIPHAEQDRLFSDDIQTSLSLLRSRRMVDAVEARIGPLN